MEKRKYKDLEKEGAYIYRYGIEYEPDDLLVEMEIVNPENKEYTYVCWVPDDMVDDFAYEMFCKDLDYEQFYPTQKQAEKSAQKIIKKIQKKFKDTCYDPTYTIEEDPEGGYILTMDFGIMWGGGKNMKKIKGWHFSDYFDCYIAPYLFSLILIGIGIIIGLLI